MTIDLGTLTRADVQMLRTCLFFDEIYLDEHKAALIAFLDLRLALADAEAERAAS